MGKRILIPAVALVAAFASATGAAGGAAGGAEIRLAQVTVNEPLPDGVPFDATPIKWNKDTAYVLDYAVAAGKERLAAIDGDSLRIDTVTAGGTDIAADADGRPAWSLVRWPGPGVSGDGGWGRFSIEIKAADGAKGAVPDVHGSIDIIRASGVSVHSVPLAVTPGATAEVGGLLFKTVWETRELPFGEKDEVFGVEVAGHPYVLAAVEIDDGGRPLEALLPGTSGTTTYLFQVPWSGTVELKVTLHEGITRQTVRF